MHVENIISTVSNTIFESLCGDETEGNRQHLHAKNVLCDKCFGRLIHENLIKKSL